MRRQGQYTDAAGMKPNPNSIAGAQQITLQQQTVAQQVPHQQMQQQYTVSNYPMPDPLRQGENHQYVTPSRPEAAQWHWDRDADPNQMNQYPPYHQGQESHSSKDPRSQAHIVDRVERGSSYEDKNTIPQTYEGLEQKFIHDIISLSKEQQDAEDAEIARHRERLSEINKQYQEKLVALRVRQAAQRDEFLRNESQSRYQQYQYQYQQQYQHQTGTNMTNYPTNPPAVPPVGASGYGAEAQQRAGYHAGYAAGAPQQRGGYYESGGYAMGDAQQRERQQQQYGGAGHSRGRGVESSRQYPGGRAYNASGRQF